MYRKLLAYFLAAVFSSGLLLSVYLPHALASIKAKGEWVFPPYTKEGGLPSNYIYYVKTNAAGEIWCCSAEGSDQKPKGGISKYIGSLDQRKPIEWVTFDKTSGLPDERVYSFDFDSAGNIWVATQNGVCKIDALGTLLYCPKELKGFPFRHIAVSPTGEVWAAKASSPGNNAALYRFDGSKWTRYDSSSATYPNGLLDYQINAITSGPRAEVWIGTNNGGASRYSPATGSWTHFTPGNSGLPNSRVNAITFDGSGNVLFGTSKTGTGAEEAAKLNPSTNSWIKYSVGNTDVVSISVSPIYGIWFGTRNEGVYLYDESKPPNQQWLLFNTTSTEEGLPNDDVRGIVSDDFGYIWFATLSGGLGRLLAKSIPEIAPGPEAAPDRPPEIEATATQGGITQVSAEEQAQEQEAKDETIKKLARTGLNLLPYLIPGLFLVILGLGSGTRSKAR